MKAAKIILVVIMIGIIGCYSVIKAQDDTLPNKPETKSSPQDNTTPSQPLPEIIPSPITPTLSMNQPLKIGIVNLAEVFDKYNKTQDYNKILGKEKMKLELAIQEIEKEMKKLSEELEMLEKTSDLYREKSEQLSNLDAKRKNKIAKWNEFVKNKNNEITLKLYKDVRDVIDNYAFENGYSCIFKSDPQLSLTPETDDVLQQISVRTVLYLAKSMDITGDIIKILNKEK
ncbi:MAG: OmpH family outer membrane protein [Planctomycetota bacterium]